MDYELQKLIPLVLSQKSVNHTVRKMDWTSSLLNIMIVKRNVENVNVYVDDLMVVRKWTVDGQCGENGVNALLNVE